MADFNLATGYVQFKGDFSQFEKDIEQAKGKVDTLNTAIASDKFKMAAYASKSINQELEKAARSAKRMMDEVKYGKMGLMFRDLQQGMSKFQDRMRSFAVPALALGGAAMGAASVASPLAADTMGGSIKLLTATIGREFVPMMARAVAIVQEGVFAWRNMSQATKDSIAETVKMTAVAGAGALALAGVTKAFSLIMAHPFLAAAGGGMLLGGMLNSKLNKAGDEQINAADKRFKESDFSFVREDGRTQQLKQRPDGLEIQRADYNRAWNVYNEAVDNLQNYQKGWLGGGSFLGGLQRGLDWTGGKQSQLIKEAEAARIQVEKHKIRFDELSAPQDRLVNNKLLSGVGAGAAGGAGAGQKFLMGSMGPSSYTSLQDFYRQLNLNTTGTSQLESETLKLQREANEIFIKQLQALESISSNSSKAN